MATDYEIHFGGIEESAGLIVDDIISASINITETALSDFSATIPKTPEARQYVQQGVYFYNQNLNEVVWFGYLEQWEQSETDLETTISGRGPLLQDSQESVNVVIESEFAEIALDSFTANSTEQFEFIPRETDDRDVLEPPSNSSAVSSTTLENQLNLATSETYTEWEIFVKYDSEQPQSVVGISDTSGGADETTTITEDATEFGHTRLTTANPTANPYVYVDVDSTYDIVKIVGFPIKSPHRYIISEEIDGTVLEGIQTLSEIAGYRFSPQDYSASGIGGEERFIQFPIGYKSAAPDWRIFDANRATDYSDYFNRVVVRGEKRDDGTRASATVQDDEEIAITGVTLTRVDRRIDLETDPECLSVAKTILDNAVQNRGESGSLKTSIPTNRVDNIIGANAPIAVWSNSFFDGGLTGTDALAFGEEASTDAVPKFQSDSWRDESGFWQIEINVFPELNKMNHETTLFSVDYETEWVTISPDGSISVTNPYGAGEGTTVSAPAGTLQNQTTHSLRIEWNANSTFLIEVDDTVVASTTDTDGGYTVPSAGLYLGNRNRTSPRANSHRVYDDSVILLTLDEASYNSASGLFSNYAFDSSMPAATEDKSFWTHTTVPSGAYREAVSTDNTGYTLRMSHADSNGRFDIGTNTLSFSCWYYVDVNGSATDNFIVNKGGVNSEGWAIDVEDTTPTLYLHNGTSGTNLSLNYDSSQDTTVIQETGEWHHLTVNIDNTNGTVESFIDGERLLNTTTAILDGSDISNTQDLLIGRLGNTTDTNEFRFDEIRLYDGRLLTQAEHETLFGTGAPYDDNFVGGVDEFIWRSGDLSRDHYFKFDDSETPNTAFEEIEGGNFDASLQAVDYAAVQAPIREISYNFFGNAEADVKFDIAGRVDTELANVRGDVENIKR